LATIRALASALFILEETRRVNSKDQARRIYVLCIAKAKAKKTLTYGEVLLSLGYKGGVPGHAIRYGLELILIACGNLDLPKLSAIVVDKATGEPAVGGYAGSSWDKDAERIFNHKKWPDVSELDWEYVWIHRKELSKKYGTPGYWGASTY
jgi:hypothetical protein